MKYKNYYFKIIEKGTMVSGLSLSAFNYKGDISALLIPTPLFFFSRHNFENHKSLCLIGQYEPNRLNYYTVLNHFQKKNLLSSYK